MNLKELETMAQAGAPLQLYYKENLINQCSPQKIFLLKRSLLIILHKNSRRAGVWYYSGIRRNALCELFQENLAKAAWRYRANTVRPNWQDKNRSSIFLAVILTEESCSAMYSGSQEPLPSGKNLSWDGVRFYSRTIALRKRRLSKDIEITKIRRQFHLKRQNVKQDSKPLQRWSSVWTFELVFMDPYIAYKKL